MITSPGNRPSGRTRRRGRRCPARVPATTQASPVPTGPGLCLSAVDDGHLLAAPLAARPERLPVAPREKGPTKPGGEG
eukprot:10419374-Alexandrium_andersonii.AAC.1